MMVNRGGVASSRGVGGRVASRCSETSGGLRQEGESSSLETRRLAARLALTGGDDTGCC